MCAFLLRRNIGCDIAFLLIFVGRPLSAFAVPVLFLDVLVVETSSQCSVIECFVCTSCFRAVRLSCSRLSRKPRSAGSCEIYARPVVSASSVGVRCCCLLFSAFPEFCYDAHSNKS